MEQQEELKKELLVMFAWFHQFCNSEGLRYYMIGGTMLGAARHQGFIPWDDDVDVGMPREDYEKLTQLLSQQKDGRYFLETPDMGAKDYFYPYAKLYDTQTTLIENRKIPVKRGIFLDIFPLDGAGNTEKESERTFSKVKFRYNLLMTRVAAFRKGRSFLKNVSVAVGRMLPIPQKLLLTAVIKESKKKPYDDCLWVGNLVGAWGMKEVMPRTIMGEPTVYQFEGFQVYGVQCPDEYLTRVYGQWRELPPPEKRISHHDFLLMDLNKPFREGN